MLEYQLVVLYLHSTSNHNMSKYTLTHQPVVLYLHSTSNHNVSETRTKRYNVVLYLHSTSNHNNASITNIVKRLYYIFILHQTTTEEAAQLYAVSCIISSFYIKPQHIPLTLLIFSRLKTILGDMKLFDETYLIQSY